VVIDFQMHWAAVNVAKGFQHIQKASSAFNKGKAVYDHQFQLLPVENMDDHNA